MMEYGNVGILGNIGSGGPSRARPSKKYLLSIPIFHHSIIPVQLLPTFIPVSRGGVFSLRELKAGASLRTVKLSRSFRSRRTPLLKIFGLRVATPGATPVPPSATPWHHKGRTFQRAAQIRLHDLTQAACHKGDHLDAGCFKLLPKQA